MAAFLEVNGIELPCPSTGLEIILSDAVNSGRNANAEVIAEKVGKTNLKYNNLRWAWLTRDEWSLICSVFENFFVVAKVWNPIKNDFESIKMYPGDRTGEVYWLEEDGITPKNFKDCKVNIIDCGLIENKFNSNA
jgi:hypothetical protein